MPRLVCIMKESGDPSLRLSALWDVKNVLRKYGDERDVMSHLLIIWSSTFFIYHLFIFLFTLFLQVTG